MMAQGDGSVEAAADDQLTYTQLRDLVRSAGSGALQLPLTAIAQDLSSAALTILNTAALKIEKLKIPELSDARIRLNGILSLPVPGRPGQTVSLAFAARFEPSSTGVSYTLAFAPDRNAFAALAGDLAKLLSAIPLKPESLWLTFSDLDLTGVQIETPGRELAEAAVTKGTGVLFQFESKLFKSLELDKVIFHVPDFERPLQLDAKLNLKVRIGSVASFALERLKLDGPDSVTLVGQGTLNLLNTRLIFDADLALTAGGVSIEVPIQKFVAAVDNVLFKVVAFENTKAQLTGTLAAYGVGLTGEFVIEGSGNRGTYTVAYSAGASDPIPDLFELDADRLTLSDALSIMSGARISIPAVDRLVMLEHSYLYYAKKPGLKTRSGVASVVGAQAHTDIKLLGYRAYAEVKALADGKSSASLRLDPIRLGGLIEIRGSGAATPAGYRGTAVRKGAIELSIDTEAREITGSIGVAVFGRASVGCLAKLSDSHLSFSVPVSLPSPLGRLDFAGELTRDKVVLESDIGMSLDVSAEWGAGRFRIAKAAQVEGRVRVVAGPSGAEGTAEIRAKLGPVSVAFPMNFDPAGIDKLADQIRAEVTKQILEALQNAAVWLQAVLDKAIEFIEWSTGDLPEQIAMQLEHTFKLTAKEAAIALRKAGYTLNNAYCVLEHMQEEMLRNVVNVMSDAAAYSEREIVAWMRTVCRSGNAVFEAREVATYMLLNRLPAIRVISEIQDMMKDLKSTAEVLGQLDRPAYEVVKFLKDAGAPVKDAAEWLARAFVFITQEEVKAVLRTVNYAPAEVNAAIANVWRESGRVIQNIRDELGRAWSNYAPRITIGWKW